jgi:fibrillarin-like rRNA methylase
MWKDPVVEETRKLREQYASKFNHNVDAIYEDIQQRQAQSVKKPVSLPSRKPSKSTNAA